MPQDTLFYSLTPIGATDVEITYPGVQPKTYTAYTPSLPKTEEKAAPVPGWVIILGCVAIILIKICIYQPRDFARMTQFMVRNRRREKKIAALLEEKFPYYQLLPENDKKKFARRVYQFRRCHKFRFTDMPCSNDVCYMVSAAAVQLCFGLREFCLRTFDYIHILPDNYRHLLFNQPLEGHITEGNIYLSWKHFQFGYAVTDNRDNVGLHEMAHALAYECFVVKDGDNHFSNFFHSYSVIARPVFEEMKQGRTTMLGDYACNNYDEFWAVSVEAFFNRPEQMKRELPELYGVMCVLLNQDTAAMQLAGKVAA